MENELIAALDAVEREIKQLEQLRECIRTYGKVKQRPAETAHTKHNLSPESRERIASAQRKRWEEHRKGKGNGKPNGGPRQNGGARA